MRSNEFDGSIGVFDSGVGGISVLGALVRKLPHENFVYYGDSAHAPYGEKTIDEVRMLSSNIVDNMLRSGCKAIVIACNTATSAAADKLRMRYPNTPIIGLEPALKPAVLAKRHGRVLVMATPMTVKLEKFRNLMGEWGGEAEVVTVACTGLAARIEQGNLDSPDLTELLRELVGMHANKVDAVVLGCTHYPFIKKQIAGVVGDVPFFDGAAGTARQLKRRLAAASLLSDSKKTGQVKLLSSKDSREELELYQRFYEAAYACAKP